MYGIHIEISNLTLTHGWVQKDVLFTLSGGSTVPTILDCQGEPCPNPVLRCKQAINNPNVQNLRILVDNQAAQENVSRFLLSQGWNIDKVLHESRLWTIMSSPKPTGHLPAPSGETIQPACTVCGTRLLVFLTTDIMGQGDDSLGQRLMHNFITTLPELGEALWRIILLNGAVRLATIQNPMAEKLQALEAAGVSILVCGTCLEHFQLMDKKIVGQVTNMLDVVTSQQVADKIITV